MSKTDSFTSWVSSDWSDGFTGFIGHTKHANDYLYPSSSGSDAAARRTDSWNATQSSEVTIAESGGEDGWIAALVLTQSDGTGFGVWANLKGAANRCTMYIWNFPDFTEYDKAELILPVPGPGDTIKCDYDGTTIKGYINTTEHVSWTRSGGNSTGTPGIASFYASGEDIGIDSWTGTGEVVGGGGRRVMAVS